MLPYFFYAACIQYTVYNFEMWPYIYISPFTIHQIPAPVKYVYRNLPSFPAKAYQLLPASPAPAGAAFAAYSYRCCQVFDKSGRLMWQGASYEHFDYVYCIHSVAHEHLICQEEVLDVTHLKGVLDISFLLCYTMYAR